MTQPEEVAPYYSFLLLWFFTSEVAVSLYITDLMESFHIFKVHLADVPIR